MQTFSMLLFSNMNLLIRLRNLDEVELIDLLKLSSDDIVDAFLDRIEENEDALYEVVKDRELYGYQEDEGI